MSNEALLDDLLSLWMRAWQTGRDMPALELCRDHPGLVPELERRIQALRELKREAPPLATTVDERTAESMSEEWSMIARRGATAAGSMAVAGYEVLGELGRGGMGVVYKARQVGLNRLVALKMILAGGHAGASDLARFKIESEAIARLQHPNIVQVFDVGQHDGLPYFSLEFCSQGSLAHKLRDTPLPAREAAFLVETLARAMQAAHEKGIVHRDLKPANILLSLVTGHSSLAIAKGQMTNDQGQVTIPKITDFGLAKQLDSDAGQTATGAVMGTPSYMAPEQAAGQIKEIGPPTDVYALGAILYEVMTGRPPFKAATVPETLEQVRTQEPVPPSSLQPTLPRDLETICLKCLQKEPVRRYASAVALAEDLRRYANGEPIQARQVGHLEKAWRWCRRNRAVASLIGAVAVALVIGTAVSTPLAVWALGERNRANTNALNEADQRRLAEDHAKDAQDAVDKYLNIVTDNPNLKEKDLFELRKALLETALPFYEKFVKQQSNDPKLKAARGQAYHRLGLVRNAIGEKEAARGNLEQARAIFTALAAEFQTEPTYRKELAASHSNLGMVQAALGKGREAEAAYRAAIETFANLTAISPAISDYRQDLAKCHRNLGALLVALGRGREAEAPYSTALQIQEKLVADFPGLPEFRQEMALTLNNQGYLLDSLRNRVKAEAAYRAALEIQKQLNADFPKRPAYRQDLARSHNNLGSLLGELKRYGEAEKELRAALNHYEQLAADFRSLPAYRQALARNYNNLGLLLASIEKSEDAARAYRKALKVREDLANGFPNVPDYAVELGNSYKNYGNLLIDGGDPQAALDWFARAFNALEPVLKDEPRLVTARQALYNVHVARGTALDMLQRHDESVKAWDRALELDGGRHKAGLQQAKARSLLLSGMNQGSAWPLLWGWGRF